MYQIQMYLYSGFELGEVFRSVLNPVSHPKKSGYIVRRVLNNLLAFVL